MTNGSAAPVCPVSRSQTPPGMPGIRVPAIPRATDLPSLIAAVNAINMLIQQLVGPSTVTNNVSPQGGPAGGSAWGPSGGPVVGVVVGGWAEASRVANAVEVEGKEDPDSRVEVLRISQVTSKDPGSNGEFIWSWPG